MMKTKLITVAVLCCMMTVFIACTNDDTPVVPANGQAMITINTAALYEELDIKHEMTEELANSNYVVTCSVLIYDQTRQLVSKQSMESITLQPQNMEITDLPDGTYTIVAWQTARDKQEDSAWTLSGEGSLTTASLIAPSTPMSYALALGYASAIVTATDGSFKVSLSPKSIGSIVELKVDNFTEETDYITFSLWGLRKQHNIGMRLDPTCSEPDCWIKDLQEETSNCICLIEMGKTSGKFFTIAHGDALNIQFWADKIDAEDFITDLDVKLEAGEQTVGYFDLGRRYWQPPFFGTQEAFKAWKAERDAGIIVSQPFLKWGCSIADVEQHMQAKQWWWPGNDELEYWEEKFASWHRWYYVAPLLTEQYLFESENGDNLRYALTCCWVENLPIEVAYNSLLEQGYVYKGKKQRADDTELYDLFLSPDGLTEAYTTCDEENFWFIIYQPVNS